MGPKLRSRLLSFVFSEGMQNFRRRSTEWRRKLLNRRHVVSVFLELDDPYSYLLCHYLPELQSHYDIELRLYLTEAMTGVLRPEPELYPEYALTDCRRLACELAIPFLDKGASPAVEHRRALLNALATREGSADYKDELLHGIAAYWRGDAESVARRADSSDSSADANGILSRNQKLLAKLGHYATAMIHYGGEWYWGVDRLHYLCERLDALGVARGTARSPKLAAVQQIMQVDLPVRPPAAARKLPPMEVFHSFRSPYSYIGLEPMFEIADAFGLDVVLRPVMPMVMRGMKVPKSKMLYFIFDAAREARRRGIAFGRISDPLGPGIARCQAVLQYAISERKGREFLVDAGREIWSNATDVGTDEGLRKVASKTGLFWPDVLASLENDRWRDITEANRQSMLESGSWGVPTIRIGDFVIWGQDRDWIIVRHLEELCDSGDGILV